jgi:ubiquinone/menaquinone biosynthesis C-methylase UbiE
MSPVDRSLVPPREMLFDGSSSEEQFILLGENFCRYILIQRAYLQPQSSFLDVGCGNGSVAVYLTRYLTTQGRYEGLDVHPDGIAWLQQRYAAYPNFRFTLADV